MGCARTDATRNHIDGNTANNFASNLEYVTPRENVRHAMRTGLRHDIGERNPNARISDETVRDIRSAATTGNVKRADLARRFGVGLSQIGRILRNEQRQLA